MASQGRERLFLKKRRETFKKGVREILLRRVKFNKIMNRELSKKILSCFTSNVNIGPLFRIDIYLVNEYS